MAWGGMVRSTAAVVTAAVLLVVSGCAEQLDVAHTVQTRIGRLVGVADVAVAVPASDRGARIEVVLRPGLDDAAVVALAAEVDGVAAAVAYPSYRLDLLEPGTADGLVLDDTFAADRRAASVVAAWRRTAGALVGDTTLTYEGGRTTVRVASDGGLAHDVAEAGRLPLPPGPVTWRFESGPGTVLVDGRIAPADVDLVERVQRSVVSPSLPVAARSWRLERRRTHASLDLAVDLGTTPAALTVADWGPRLAPLAQAASVAVGQPRRRIELRLTHPSATGTDVLAWWTSTHPPTPGRDPLRRGWDTWLTDQVAAV